MSRLDVVVTGTVQGVGFRPFVHQLASRLGLAGWVRNKSGAVEVALEGSSAALEAFLFSLQSEAPPLARIEDVSSSLSTPQGMSGFCIVESECDSSGEVRITPDSASCADCLQEIDDPHGRRCRYVFTCCTRCGPRLTMVTGAPWDRSRTTMASFPMCESCRVEYEDPSDRRFHAEPIACPRCGPRLVLLGADGVAIEVDPIVETARRLREGAIVAVKGLGGFHLAVDARSQEAVTRLRQRKARDARPFAVMVSDLEAARRIVEISDEEERLLTSAARPIVLIRGVQRGLCESVSRGLADVGLMLPYTPLHHLLLRELDAPLVMTSGNPSEEPIVHLDEDARTRLGDIADAFLMHDRAIRVRCDDSVARIVSGRVLPVRRSRGYAPAPLALARALEVPMLATGGHLKATFALGRASHAILSHHLGDLDELRTWQAYRDAVAHYERLFEIEPRLIVHDAHPDYASTRYALERAQAEQIPTLAVQHHRAHIASCMTEHGLDGNVIGVAFDGAGYGDDGTLWGGEVFAGGYGSLEREAHLRSLALPGGERAMREPWRMAIAFLLDAGLPLDGVAAPSTRARETVVQMIERGIHSPRTSSMGRLFDAVSALCGVCTENSYEGQAATELETLAVQCDAAAAYGFRIDEPPSGPRTIDARPLVAELVSDLARGRDRATVARRFHESVAAMVVECCERIRATRGFERVVLSGGVFMNALLLQLVITALRERAFVVFSHERVPPNDGGLCLGQLAIASALFSEPSSTHGEQ